MRAVCQIKFVLLKFVFKKNLVFKHQEQRIREICEIRVPKNIRFIHKIRVQKNLMFKCERTAANKDP